MYGSAHSLIERFPTPLTYPISRVYTVILNIGIARVWTLIAVDPVDGSGKRSTVLFRRLESVCTKTEPQAEVKMLEVLTC